MKCGGNGIREYLADPSATESMWYIQCAWCGQESAPDWEYSAAWAKWDALNTPPGNIFVNEVFDGRST